MNLKDAVAVAKRHIGERFAADAPQDIRLENFLYDDHLMVWTLTLGFAGGQREAGREIERHRAIVRVSETSKAVLSSERG